MLWRPAGAVNAICVPFSTASPVSELSPVTRSKTVTSGCRRYSHFARAQLALHGEASIDGDRRPRHEIRGRARQKNRDPGEILRITPAARGRTREHALVEAVNSRRASRVRSV